MRRVTQIEIDEWKRLYEDRGLSISAIARRADRNHHVVYYHLLKAGTRIRSGSVGAEVTPSEVDTWVTLFMKGEAPERFPECLRTSQTIYKHLAFRLREDYCKLIGKEVMTNDE